MANPKNRARGRGGAATRARAGSNQDLRGRDLAARPRRDDAAERHGRAARDPHHALSRLRGRRHRRLGGDVRGRRRAARSAAWPPTSRAEAFQVELASPVAGILIGPAGSRLSELEGETGKLFAFETRDDLPAGSSPGARARARRRRSSRRRCPSAPGEELDVRLVERHLRHPEDAIARLDGYVISVAGAAGPGGRDRARPHRAGHAHRRLRHGRLRLEDVEAPVEAGVLAEETDAEAPDSGEAEDPARDGHRPRSQEAGRRPDRRGVRVSGPDLIRPSNRPWMPRPTVRRPGTSERLTGRRRRRRRGAGHAEAAGGRSRHRSPRRPTGRRPSSSLFPKRPTPLEPERARPQDREGRGDCRGRARRRRGRRVCGRSRGAEEEDAARHAGGPWAEEAGAGRLGRRHGRGRAVDVGSQASEAGSAATASADSPNGEAGEPSPDGAAAKKRTRRGTRGGRGPQACRGGRGVGRRRTHQPSHRLGGRGRRRGNRGRGAHGRSQAERVVAHAAAAAAAGPRARPRRRTAAPPSVAPRTQTSRSGPRRLPEACPSSYNRSGRAGPVPAFLRLKTTLAYAIIRVGGKQHRVREGE